MIRQQRKRAFDCDKVRPRRLDLVDLQSRRNELQHRPIIGKALRLELNDAHEMIVAQFDIIARAQQCRADRRLRRRERILLRRFPEFLQLRIRNRDARIIQFGRSGVLRVSGARERDQQSQLLQHANSFASPCEEMMKTA